MATFGALATVALVAACAARAAPLRGVPAPASLPEARLEGSQRITFRWEYEEGSIVARGEGIARITAPDSARLDLFLDGGFGGGWALLFGDSLTAPGGALLRNMLPPPPMLWAAVGRLAVPPAPDTTAAVDGSLLHADIGRNPTWRASFEGSRLARLERIEDSRRIEWVVRNGDGSVRYDHPGDTRSLRITISRVEEVPGFDPSIWRP